MIRTVDLDEDCPHCGASRSVERGLCVVCLEDVDEPGVVFEDPAQPSRETA